jgi:hypothetical protein
MPLGDVGLALVYTGVYFVTPLFRSDSSPDVEEPFQDQLVRVGSLGLAIAHAASAVSGTVWAERCGAQRYAAASSPVPAPAAPRPEMWCTQTPTRAACARSEGVCHRLRGELAPDGTAPPCEPTEPVCFRVDGALRVCAPDYGSCARERDLYAARSDGNRSLSECSD